MFWVRGLLGICINYLCKINGVLPFPWHAGRGNVRQMGLWFTVGMRGRILGAVSHCRGWTGMAANGRFCPLKSGIFAIAAGSGPVLFRGGGEQSDGGVEDGIAGAVPLVHVDAHVGGDAKLGEPSLGIHHGA